MGSKVRFVSDYDRIRPENSEVFRLCCDNRKINKLTGFEPEIDLLQGLRITIDWFTQPQNLIQYKSDIYNV